MLAKKEGVTPETHRSYCRLGGRIGASAGCALQLAGWRDRCRRPTFQALLTYAEQFGAYVHRTA